MNKLRTFLEKIRIKSEVKRDRFYRIDHPYYLGTVACDISHPPFPFDVERKYTLYEVLQEPKTPNIESMLSEIRENIITAEFCKEKGIPLHPNGDGFVNPRDCVFWYQVSKNPIQSIMQELERNLRSNGVQRFPIKGSIRENIINNNRYWFYDKEFFDQIIQENPECSPEELS